MSKRYYLSKANFGREYFLDDGSFGKGRMELGDDEDFLISNIKSKLSKRGFRRDTDFYIVKDNVSEESIRQIRKLFSDSKVRVSLVSYLSVG